MTTIKGEVIPLFPNLPGSYDENLHEERPLKLLFSIDHHLEEIHGEVPMYAQKLPTGLAERAAEEKMKKSFFTATIAKYTIVIIQNSVFSSQNISSV